MHIRLPTQLSFSAHLSGHARYFRCEGTKLIDHRINGVFQTQNLPAYIDGDCLRQVALRNCGRDFSDVTYLSCKITCHRIDAVSQILPRTRDTFHIGLATEFPFRAYLTCHPGHFRCKRTQLIHHRINRVLQFENFTFHVDGDLL